MFCNSCLVMTGEGRGLYSIFNSNGSDGVL